jgi:hypothetical protein
MIPKEKIISIERTSGKTLDLLFDFGLICCKIRIVRPPIDFVVSQAFLDSQQSNIGKIPFSFKS